MWGGTIHTCGGPYDTYSIYAKGDYQIPIPYMVWGNHKSLTVTGFPQWTLIMKTLNIDSYKVPAVDFNHTVYVGGWCVLASEDLGL